MKQKNKLWQLWANRICGTNSWGIYYYKMAGTFSTHLFAVALLWNINC